MTDFQVGICWLGLEGQGHGTNLFKEPCSYLHPTGLLLCRAWGKCLLKRSENGLGNQGCFGLAGGQRLSGGSGVSPRGLP